MMTVEQDISDNSEVGLLLTTFSLFSHVYSPFHFPYLCHFLFFPWFFSLLFLVLQLRLQQRRTREQLVDQGIMPRK